MHIGTEKDFGTEKVVLVARVVLILSGLYSGTLLYYVIYLFLCNSLLILHVYKQYIIFTFWCSNIFILA